jgi:hypothetical protein
VADLPSTGDDNWDAWLRAFIERVQQKRWLDALTTLVTIQRQIVTEMSDALKKERS